MAKQQPKKSASTAARAASDGTREYRPHSSHAAADFAGLNAAVFDGLQQQAFYPGLMFSGEAVQPNPQGRLAYRDDVVRKQVELREEFPYG